MKQTTKNIYATWLFSLAAIPFIVFIIVGGIMFSVEPSSLLKDKYKETEDSVLLNITMLNCDGTTSLSCSCSCYYPEYRFAMLRSNNSCIIKDQSDTYTSSDLSKVKSNFSFDTTYSMYSIVQNGTIYCDPTVAQEYMQWLRLVISTGVFGGLTFFMIFIGIGICVCGTRCQRFCCHLDAGSKPLIEKDDNVGCEADCGC